MASPVQPRRGSGGAPSRLAALTALSRPANLRPSYSDSEATPNLLAEAPIFETLVFAKRPVPQRGSTHATSSPPRAAGVPLSPTSVAPSPQVGSSSRLTSPDMSATTARSVRTPSLCRSETSVGTSASDAAALASAAPSRCPSGGPTSPVAPNVSLLSAALLSEQAQCATLRPGCGILVKDGAARTASQDRAAHASFAADIKPAHARAHFVEPVKPPRQSRRVSLPPQPPAQHRESTSPDYMSEGFPAPVQKSILAPAATVFASSSGAAAAAPASPAPRKRSLMFEDDIPDAQDRAASRSALGLSQRTSRQASPSVVPASSAQPSSLGEELWSSPEVRTGWSPHTPTLSVEARLHPCDVSPRIASSVHDSPAAEALHLAASAYSPPAAASTPRSSLRFCGAAATEAARARTLKFASSPGEAAERRAASAAATGEPRSKLFAPLARRAPATAEATHRFSSDDEAPYVDAVADEAERHTTSNNATQRRVVLVAAARSPRKSGERAKRVGRTCGSPAPARLSYQEKISAMRGAARGGGSPAPLGVQVDEDEEADEYDDDEEDDESEEFEISGSESEEEESPEEEEEESDDEDAQAQQEDGSASSCSSTGDIVTGTLMDEEVDAPTASSSRPASRLQLTHFLPDTFDSSAPSSPTWPAARDGDASASATSSAAASRSVSALTLPLARQPSNIARRVSGTSRDASPSGSISSSHAEPGRLAPRSPPSPLMTLGRLPMHRSPLGRAQPSTQRSLSSGAATRGTPSAAACSMLAAAGHGAVSPRSPTSGDDAWHRLRHYLDVGHSDGGESTPGTTAAASPGAAGTLPRYFANPAQSRARSVPPGMVQSEARIGSAPASPTPTGYFALLHKTLGQHSNPATDSETDQRPPPAPSTTSAVGSATATGARVLFSEEATRPRSAGGAQAPIRIARPAPNAQSKSDAELSGCAALRRTGLGGAARRRAAAAADEAGELEGGEVVGKEREKMKEARRRRRRTADAELAWGWGKARLGGLGGGGGAQG